MCRQQILSGLDLTFTYCAINNTLWAWPWYTHCVITKYFLGLTLLHLLCRQQYSLGLTLLHLLCHQQYSLCLTLLHLLCHKQYSLGLTFLHLLCRQQHSLGLTLIHLLCGPQILDSSVGYTTDVDEVLFNPSCQQYTVKERSKRAHFKWRC